MVARVWGGWWLGCGADGTVLRGRVEHDGRRGRIRHAV